MQGSCLHKAHHCYCLRRSIKVLLSPSLPSSAWRMSVQIAELFCFFVDCFGVLLNWLWTVHSSCSSPSIFLLLHSCIQHSGCLLCSFISDGVGFLEKQAGITIVTFRATLLSADPLLKARSRRINSQAYMHALPTLL